MVLLRAQERGSGKRGGSDKRAAAARERQRQESGSGKRAAAAREWWYQMFEGVLRAKCLHDKQNTEMDPN